MCARKTVSRMLKMTNDVIEKVKNALSSLHKHGILLHISVSTRYFTPIERNQPADLRITHAQKKATNSEDSWKYGKSVLKHHCEMTQQTQLLISIYSISAVTEEMKTKSVSS